jgi:hypothetical protein
MIFASLIQGVLSIEEEKKIPIYNGKLSNRIEKFKSFQEGK